MQTPTLRGDRVTLVPRAAEYAAFIAQMMARPEVNQFVAYGRTENWEARITQEMSDPHVLAWIILVGNTSIGEINLTGVDYYHCRANLGITVDLGHQQQGYGLEALRLVCEYTKVPLGFKNITLTVLGSNVRALQIYQRFGFTTNDVVKDGRCKEVLRDEV